MKNSKKIFTILILILFLITIGTFSAANTTQSVKENMKSHDLTKDTSIQTATVSDKKFEKNTVNYSIKKSPQANSHNFQNKTEAKITLLPIKGVIGENITLTAYLKDDKNNNISGGNLAFKLNGKTLRKDNRFDSNEEAMKLPVKME